MDIIINTDGSLRFIYNDELSDLLTLGAATIQRASHVEPADTGGWFADMSPSGGPVLGPFQLRSTALAEEVKWLQQNRGL